VNREIVPSCINVAVAPDTGAKQSEADCGYKLDDSDTIALGETFVGRDGWAGSGQSNLAIASPAEVAIIGQECQEAKSLLKQC
jgi:hypothetical protein